MDEYTEEDLRNMELLPTTESITTEVVLLRDLDEIKKLYDSLKATNTGDNSIKNVDWGKRSNKPRWPQM